MESATGTRSPTASEIRFVIEYLQKTNKVPK